MSVRRLLRRLALAIGLLAAAAACAAPAPRRAEPPPIRLGASTHFGQGWDLQLAGAAGRVGLGSVRDEISWTKVETVAGRYDFTSFNTGFVNKICGRGTDVLLTIDPRNPLYDRGQTVFTPAGQAAFARFLDALLDRFGPNCVIAVEIGNEINGAGGHSLPPGLDLATVYAALLATVYPPVHAHHPQVALLGGSTNVIGTGFLERIMAAGGLAHMDGVAVHPYRPHPETVDIEIGRLNAAMRRHGGEKPIWATEFGEEFDDPGRSPGFFLKMLTLMSTSGVHAAYWYALLDEPFFRNMGLFDPRQRFKPAGEAVRFATGMLLPGARVTRVAGADPRTNIYAFAPDRLVMWGSPRPIRFTGDPRITDAQGRVIPAPDRLGDEPFVVTGRFGYTLGDDPVLADTRYEYERAPWRYFARSRDGRLTPLAWIDWEWTGYFGLPGQPPLAIGSDGLVPAGDGANPLAAMLRYTAPAAARAILSACFTARPGGDGMDLAVYHNGRRVFATLVTQRTQIADLALDLAAGDTLDLALGPNQTLVGDGAKFRIRLVRAGSGLLPLCD